MLVQFSNSTLIQDHDDVNSFLFKVAPPLTQSFDVFDDGATFNDISFFEYISPNRLYARMLHYFIVIAYASGECLSTIGTQNVAANKFCMVFVMEPVIDVELVGRIRPVYNNLPFSPLLNLVY